MATFKIENPNARAMTAEQWRRVVSDRVEMAKKGDHDSELWLMREYINAINHGGVPVVEILKFFAFLFGEVLALESELFGGNPKTLGVERFESDPDLFDEATKE